MSVKDELLNDVKNDKLQHLALIPFDERRIKRDLDLMMQLNEQQRTVIFVMVKEVIRIMNESGMNKWYPDKLKPILDIIFNYGFSASKELQDAINGKMVQIPTVINSKEIDLFPGLKI